MALSKFKNEPLTDFTKPANRKTFAKALERVRSGLGKEFPLVIGEEEFRTDAKLKSTNPSNPSEVLASFQKATPELAAKAVESASAAFETWKTVPARKRVELILKAAQKMRARKHEFSAVMVLEVGKTWPEADADTAEAIDFLEFYGREMLRYDGPQPVTKIPGEKNELRYIPLGGGRIIHP